MKKTHLYNITNNLRSKTNINKLHEAWNFPKIKARKNNNK